MLINQPTAILKSQAPNHNNQIIINYPNFNDQNRWLFIFWISFIGIWNLFDYWCLVFGISYVICTNIKKGAYL